MASGYGSELIHKIIAVEFSYGRQDAWRLGGQVIQLKRSPHSTASGGFEPAMVPIHTCALDKPASVWQVLEHCTRTKIRAQFSDGCIVSVCCKSPWRLVPSNSMCNCSAHC